MRPDERDRVMALTDEVQRLAKQLAQESGEVRSRREVARSLRLAAVGYWVDVVAAEVDG